MADPRGMSATMHSAIATDAGPPLFRSQIEDGARAVRPGSVIGTKSRPAGLGATAWRIPRP
jgi:hypothetical protein